MTQDDLITVIAFLGVVGLAAILTRFVGKPRATTDTPPQDKRPRIIVDGSNVMFWGGDPSIKPLQDMADSLRAKGFQPFFVFDANVGYKLQDRYIDDAEMAWWIGVPSDNVLVVEKGVIADERILQIADENGTRVVSNDRFRDWGTQYPWVRKKGRVVRGTFKGGALKWQSL